MKLRVKSRRLAEIDNDLEEPHIIVSIRDPGSSVPDLDIKDTTKKVVFLQFDDIDRMPRPGSATHHVLGNNPIMFTPAMAQQVIDALKETEVDAAMVHCEAGISRSAGLAAALSKYFDGDDSEFFHSPAGMYAPQRNVYRPNMHVYSVMLRALHES